MLKGLRHELVAVLSVVFMLSIGASAYEPIFSRYVATFTLDPIVIGLIVALNAAVFALFAEPAGQLCDKVGIRRVLMAGAAVQPLGYLLWWASPSLLLLAGASLVVGFGTALFWGAVRTYVSTRTTKRHTGLAFGAYHMSWAMGWSFGPLIGGWLAVEVIRMPFLFGVVVMAVTGLLLGKLVKDKEPNSKKRLSFELVRHELFSYYSLTSGLRFLKHISRRSRWLLSIYFLMGIFWSVVFTYFPLLFVQYSNFEVGILFFISSLAFGASVMFAGDIVDRLGRKKFLLASMVATAFFGGLFVFSVSFEAAFAYMLLVGLASSFIYPALDSLLMSHVHKRHRGAASGFMLTANGFGFVAGRLIGGGVATFAGFGGAMLFGIGIVLVAAAYSIHALR